MAHMRQPMPNHDPGFQLKYRRTIESVPSSFASRHSPPPAPRRALKAARHDNVRHPMPDHDLGFQLKDLKLFKVFLLGLEAEMLFAYDGGCTPRFVTISIHHTERAYLLPSEEGKH